jgi:hypothetical protein
MRASARQSALVEGWCSAGRGDAAVIKLWTLYDSSHFASTETSWYAESCSRGDRRRSWKQLAQRQAQTL